MGSESTTPNGAVSLLSMKSLPNEWRLARLGDMSTVRRGSSPRPAGDPRYFGGKIPWFKIGDATKSNSRFLSETAEFVNEEGAKRSVRISKGTLIISNSGVSLGFAVFVGVEGCVHDGWLIVDRFEGLNPLYVYYYVNLLTPSLRGMADGTTQPNLNTTIAKSLIVPVPPLKEQVAIATILGSLDDKIELNRVMNATLEQVAQALFKSWFVDFDPVKAKAVGRVPEGMDAETAALFPSEFEDSELGPIPKGWSTVSLREVYEIFDNRRIPLSGKQRSEKKGPFPYYGAASILDYVDEYIFDGVYLLVGEDGSVIQLDGTPVLQYVNGKIWVNNHAHVLQGKGAICTEHLMLFLAKQQITAFITGAVQQKITQANLGRIPFVKATDHISSIFAQRISPLYNRLRNNVTENKSLAATRDLLLPKLISGQLRIPDIEKIVGSAM